VTAEARGRLTAAEAASRPAFRRRSRCGPAAAEHGGTFLAQLREVAAAGQIEETFVDATVRPPQVFTYAAMIAHVLTYAAYRRTLVTAALASAGIDLDDDPLWWEPLEP